MLSHSDRRRLEEIERQFRDEDPRFADLIGEHREPPRSSRRPLLTCGYVLGGLLVVIGALSPSHPLLIFGVMALVATGTVQLNSGG